MVDLIYVGHGNIPTYQAYYMKRGCVMKKIGKRALATLLSLVMSVSLLSLSVFAGDTHEHIDSNTDGYCDTCYTRLVVSVTVHTAKTVTKDFKAGTLLFKDNLRNIILSQNIDAAGLLYKDGTPVKETDVVPYNLDTLDIYAIITYKAEGPTCEKFGHKAYYLNTLDGYYYEDESCTKCIGEEKDLFYWLSSIELGGTEFPLGHLLTCCDDAAKGHFCAREECEYHNVPGSHSLGNDNVCDMCGAPYYVGCPHDPTCSDYYAFANTFVNDGEPLEYIWYYVGEDVTLTKPLIISGPDVRLLIADGVTFDAQAGYFCKTDCYFDFFYQSKGESHGTFIGTQYKCHDEKTDTYYAEHVDGNGNFICDVCGESTCTHDNITCTYKWSDDYSKCTGKAFCEDCQKILSEEEAEIDYHETSKGNCVTKGKGIYYASFDRYIATTTKKVETDFGAHSFTGSFYCRNCTLEDLMGAKMYYGNRIDKLLEMTDSEDMRAILGMIRDKVNAATSVGEVRDAFDDYRDKLDEAFPTLGLLSYKEEIKSSLKSHAKATQYEKASLAYISEIEPLIDRAENAETLVKTENDTLEYIRSLEELKNGYFGELVEKYMSSTSEAEKSAIICLIYEISSAVHTEDVEKIYSSAEERIALAVLVPLKKEAKNAIEQAAGENQSEKMQSIVEEAKKEIDGAKTVEQVENAKQQGLSAVEEQKNLEQIKPSGDKELCPKCGTYHSNSTLGQIYCFFIRLFDSIIRLFK